MQFRITLQVQGSAALIPINYQYPLSAALYRIIAKGDKDYAGFLHEKGYGKGFKFFTFSQINCPFRIEGDRLRLLNTELSFQVAFHIPKAMESFVKGLFQSAQIDIADKISKASCKVKSVESLPNPLQEYKDNEIISVQLKPLSPLVAGLQNEKGNYDFLSPADSRFTESLIYNWRSKIKTSYDSMTGSEALLFMKVLPMKQTFKSRLITIKADTPQKTNIRGWMSFKLKITAEKRLVELLINTGAGVYNAMGFGCVELVAE
ncbi:MAG TPA: CRISPR-associated endoribonuclease Cas6 [Chitinophagaceae bacterium]|nr:CRISPR-associated endoribonuclease Cas6 [Chitinophagaceae bacterium]